MQASKNMSVTYLTASLQQIAQSLYNVMQLEDYHLSGRTRSLNLTGKTKFLGHKYFRWIFMPTVHCRLKTQAISLKIMIQKLDEIVKQYKLLFWNNFVAFCSEWTASLLNKLFLHKNHAFTLVCFLVVFYMPYAWRSLNQLFLQEGKGCSFVIL